MKYLVTAAYADVVDEPQVYETEVEADSVEEAEQVAQRQAIEDNGGTVGEDDEAYALTDIFARPVTRHEALEREIKRLRSAAARALERVDVDDCGEAEMILRQVVNLDGSPVGARDPGGACIEHRFLGGVERIDFDHFAVAVVQEHDLAREVAETMLRTRLPYKWNEDEPEFYAEFEVTDADTLREQLTSDGQ